ncbi:MAG: VWA-like domain-containing protein [Gammaproteobacteria bacterium]|nr:VWA-like domain-containing protein [Gammaproteobacteria bacterium]
MILDTSGSIRYRLHILQQFWGEVREVARELETEEVLVLQVDTRVQEVARYARDDLPEAIEIRGGGGTDFRPGFAWLAEQDPPPGICLYLTDMECSSYPQTEPAFPTVWCNWGKPPGPRHREPWGERIDLAGPGRP